MSEACIQNIIGRGEIQQRREVEDCEEEKCPRHDSCKKNRGEEYHKRYCMNGGEGCSYNLPKTAEERRMEI